MDNRLKEIIRESIRNILSEDSIHAKKRTQKNIINAFRKGKSGYNGIRTMAVLTSENPDSQTVPRNINRKNLKMLHKSLKSANYVSIPSKGQWGGEKENPYTIINISRESAARYCGKYQQTSFCFYELEGDSTVNCEYWEKEDPNLPYHPEQNNYIKKGQTKEIIETPNADDNFSQIGKEFKYSAVFENINESIGKNLNVMMKNGFGGKNNTVETIMEFAINRKGQTPYIYRGHLYKGILEKKKITYEEFNYRVC